MVKKAVTYTILLVISILILIALSAFLFDILTTPSPLNPIGAFIVTGYLPVAYYLNIRFMEFSIQKIQESITEEEEEYKKQEDKLEE